MKKHLLSLLCLFSLNAYSITLKDSLIAYYPFNGSASDLSGNGYDLTVTGPSLTADRNGNNDSAYSFNGSSDQMTSGNINMKNSKEVTLSAWVKTSPAGLNYFLTAANFGFFATGSSLGFAISTPSTNSASASMKPGEWTHIAGTYDGTNIKTYINGDLKATTNWPSSITFDIVSLKIGVFGSNFWAGSLDEVYLYNRVLSDSEVLTLYNGVITGINSPSSKNFNVFPVPSSNTIQLPDGLIHESTVMTISNSLGIKVKEIKADAGASIDIEGLQKGFYTLTFLSEEKRYTAKFIKE